GECGPGSCPRCPSATARHECRDRPTRCRKGRSHCRKWQNGSRSWLAPELVRRLESRYQSHCGPPGFRGNLTAINNSKSTADPPSRMQTLPVNGADMAYLDVGRGPPLVCVNGSLCDFRIWHGVLGPLSNEHRVIAPSLRHFFPAQWDGQGDTYSIAQHVSDVIGFIGKLNIGPVDLMGHSRGGHVAFRVAQRRPDLLRRLVLAEPGGELDATLDPDFVPGPSPLAARIATAAGKIASGDVEGGLAFFIDAIEGPGAWARLPAAPAQTLRDDAFTLIGQARDNRPPFSKADAEAIA